MRSDCLRADGSPKQGYLSKRDAKRVSHLVSARQQYAGNAIHIYRCPECRCWHVGHERSA